jgi:hypothetical protein
MDLVEVGATEEVAAGAADQLASTLRQAAGAVGAEDGVMFSGHWTGIDHRFWRVQGLRFRLHLE